ncbi:MAG: 2-oxoacid:acceptor oxidoreductase family protein [Candidatus Eisenbacteria bacterium]|nr:2-oxoacid:acceptor oxidoreductase family protein [Candidatus Eisenbacteria bacterium]
MKQRGVFTYLVGGKAGEGVKKAGSTAADLFAGMGRYVFQMDDYPSLISGGHNFVVVSTATREITSHYMKADVVVALDARSHRIHGDHLTDGGLMVFNSDDVESGLGIGVPMTTLAEKYPNPGLRVGVSGIAVLCAVIGKTREELAEVITREYRHDLENNIPFAQSVFDAVREKVGDVRTLVNGGDRLPMYTGNQAIALGAAAAGLDMYIGYPMTPASTVLHYLAARDKDLGVVVVHPESEIAVANMAVGAAAAGARVMVGTSGGGFALMEEAYSFAGMAEVPFLCVMSSRPGPSTGVPTYTEQADLRFTLGQGHGDFPRVVASPGSVSEAFTLAAELLSMVWEYQTTGMLLTEKHLSESRMTTRLDTTTPAWAEPLLHEGGGYKRYLDTADGLSPMLFPPSDALIKWNSYEHDELGITTEEADVIAMMHDKRARKAASLRERLRGMRTVNRYGDSGPLIVTYGSTTLSVLEALVAGGVAARVVQPVYLDPFPVWEFGDFGDERPIIIEQSCSGQFATLIADKTGLRAREVIRRYDGRPFEPDELGQQIAALV